ncbi:hypothetical protein IE81DRAFT_364565 [Ceraceosorus guamensis]|uniref:Uncharacterized protein n=1 Tax=Ceraceosorus guamensis TaxID=1522189 RepID=A0A316W4J5_9BASI|nr:hypothetical protein IE81DRAFT_364565 [Ceraceosorus guamensis]PWN44867.1 hypothetical protein IE81DRAFT_364565 [Ceraceosorus guamensis]
MSTCPRCALRVLVPLRRRELCTWRRAGADDTVRLTRLFVRRSSTSAQSPIHGPRCRPRSLQGASLTSTSQAATSTPSTPSVAGLAAVQSFSDLSNARHDSRQNKVDAVCKSRDAGLDGHGLREDESWKGSSDRKRSVKAKDVARQEKHQQSIVPILYLSSNASSQQQHPFDLHSDITVKGLRYMCQERASSDPLSSFQIFDRLLRFVGDHWRENLVRPAKIQEAFRLMGGFAREEEQVMSMYELMRQVARAMSQPLLVGDGADDMVESLCTLGFPELALDAQLKEGDGSCAIGWNMSRLYFAVSTMFVKASTGKHGDQDLLNSAGLPGMPEAQDADDFLERIIQTKGGDPRTVRSIFSREVTSHSSGVTDAMQGGWMSAAPIRKTGESMQDFEKRTARLGMFRRLVPLVYVSPSVRLEHRTSAFEPYDPYILLISCATLIQADPARKRLIHRMLRALNDSIIAYGNYSKAQERNVRDSWKAMSRSRQNILTFEKAWGLVKRWMDENDTSTDREAWRKGDWFVSRDFFLSRFQDYPLTKKSEAVVNRLWKST